MDSNAALSIGPVRRAATSRRHAFGSLGARARHPWAAGDPAPAQAGISAIELMMSLTLFSLIALTTVPVVGNALQAYRADGAAAQVAAVMNLTRQYAVSNVATYAVMVTDDSIQVSCNAGCPATPPGESVTPIPGAELTASITPVQFDSKGAATQAAQVTVSVPGTAARQVCVSAAGRVWVSEASCS